LKKGIENDIEQEGRVIVATLNKGGEKGKKNAGHKGRDLQEEDVGLDEDEEIVEAKEKEGKLDTVLIARKGGDKREEHVNMKHVNKKKGGFNKQQGNGNQFNNKKKVKRN